MRTMRCLPQFRPPPLLLTLLFTQLLSFTAGLTGCLAEPAITRLSRLALFGRLGKLGGLGGLALLGALLSGCQSLPANVDRSPSHAWATPTATPLGQLTAERQARESVERQARESAERPARESANRPNGFALLPRADDAYTARMALIEAAQHTLDLQYYAVNLDASSASLLDALRQAAERGVRVRLLIDDFNTAGRNAQVLRLAFVPGIELRLFNPLAGSRNSVAMRVLGGLPHFKRMQQRMHNKLFLADNAAAITGGRNLGDAYFGLGEDNNFVDLDVLALGPIVQRMGASFDQYWNHALAYPVERLVSLGELRNALALEVHASELQAAGDNTTLTAHDLGADIQQAVQHMRRKASQLPPPMDLRQVPLHWVPAQLIADQPSKISGETGEDRETVVDGMVNLMNEARHEVLLVTPYFVPGEQILARFAALRQRGVRVRVLTNSLASNDALAAHAGYARYRKALLRLGVELHELRGVMPTPSAAGTGADAGTSPGPTPGTVRSSALMSGSGSGTRPADLPSPAPGAPRRLSLHAKFVVIDERLLLVGSMNLDLRSQLQNTEIGLLMASRAMGDELTDAVETAFANASYRVTLDGEQLHWHAPPGADFEGSQHEPDTSAALRLLARLIAPIAPEALL
jgi:phosphatidylserine/phosphatidylglycerophosphate/cardiolipin synthase-like enzyme